MSTSPPQADQPPVASPAADGSHPAPAATAAPGVSGTRTPAAPVGGSDQVDPIDFAWQTHSAIQHWTASVDTKASIVLVVQTAVAGSALHELIAPDGQLHNATDLHLGVAIFACALLVAAVALALWVVFPRMKRQRTIALSSTGLVYFGHLANRQAEDIQAALEALDRRSALEQLSKQLTVTGKVAWDKHASLQWSIATFAVGVGALLLSLVEF